MEHLEQQYHMEDVGRILLQTQEELRQLRESANASDPASLSDVLQKAEQALRVKAEFVLNGLLNDKSQITLSSVHNVKEKMKLAQSTEIQPSEIDIEYIRENIKRPIKREVKQAHHIRNSTSKILKKTIKHKKLLFKVNTESSESSSSPLTTEDAKGGILSLLNRGIVPTNADLVSVFYTGNAVIKNTPMKMYPREQQPLKSIPYSNPLGFNIASLKFDMTQDDIKPSNGSVSMQRGIPEKRALVNPRTITIDFERTSRYEQGETLDAVEDNNASSMEELRKNVEKIRDYNELLDAYSLHQFIIHKGRTLRDTPEFESFKRVAQEIWGSVEERIKDLELLLSQYSVPLAYIDGQRLMVISAMDTAQIQDLLSCIVNEDQVSSFIRRPGQRYRGKDRRRKAAITIQSFIHMCVYRNGFLNRKRFSKAASYIQSVWRSYGLHQQMKKLLSQRHICLTKEWEEKMEVFRSTWNKIKSDRRIVIHVPSISIDERSRLQIENITIMQNLQLSRLCGVSDPRVDIIYVSPCELCQDVVQYQMKLLELGGIKDPQSRVKMVYPENARRFPAHFSLSTLMLYSPHCMQRIKRYIKGREAYLITGMPGPEDKRLAISLQVPLLAMDHEASALLMTKSGSKRLFVKADVNVPPGSYDIYDENELLFSLSKLLAANLDQNVWIIKLDFDPFDQGVVLVDVTNFSIIQVMRKEKQTSESSITSGTRESIVKLIFAELEKSISSIARPLHPELYGSWSEFSAVITKFGAIIELCPKRVQGYIRANIYIEPNGTVHLSSTQNHITNSRTETAIAYAFPQTHAPYEAVRGASLAIGKQLVQAGSIGHASIDYLTYFEEKSQMQRLWALRLHPFLTNSAASFGVFGMLNRGMVDFKTGKYHIKDDSKFSSSSVIHDSTNFIVQEALITHSQDFKVMAGPERAYVVCDYIFHPSLSTMQYSMFFQMCRLNGVCFDIERSIGTAFLLFDSLAAGVLGLVSVGETSPKALSYLRTALEALAREIGTSREMKQLDHAYGHFKEILMVVRDKCVGSTAKLGKLRKIHKNNENL